MSWLADDGSCLGDSEFDRRYAAAPQVEAICAAPTGSPSLPTDATPLGCNNCNPPTGDATAFQTNTCSPYIPKPWNTPWITYTKKRNCIAGEGRFADEYSEEISEATDIVSPP
jgi:hypothetical protein